MCACPQYFRSCMPPKAKRRGRGRGRGSAGHCRGAAAPLAGVPPTNELTPVPVLSDDLWKEIVDNLTPDVMLVALRVNKLFLSACTSQPVWQAVCARRWGDGGVPPTRDYRRHYVQRSAMEARSALPDQSSPADWGMHLLIEIPNEDGPVFRACLPFPEAKLCRGRYPQTTSVDSPAHASALRWDLPVKNIDVSIGACFLWSDERMCQLISTRELQKDEQIASTKFEDDWADDETGPAYDESATCEWTHLQDMNVAGGIELKRGWYFYDGSCGQLAVSASLQLTLLPTENATACLYLPMVRRRGRKCG